MNDKLEPCPTFDELENFLAERLEMIVAGKGHWADCMQMIELYTLSRALPDLAKVKAEAKAEAFEEAAKALRKDGESWELIFTDKAAALRKEAAQNNKGE